MVSEKTRKHKQPGIILAIISSKGGVGKTTLTANLGGLLADRGNRVLAVDADVQPTLSSYYELTHQAPYGLKRLITEADIEDVISHTKIDNLDIIFSDDPKGTLQNYILHTADGRQRLRFTLNQLRHQYDYIIIDTQGAAGPLQDTAIFAGDMLVSPIAPDKVSATEFQRGTLNIVNETRKQGQRLGIKLAPLYALLYRVERTVDAKSYVIALSDVLGRRPDIHLLGTHVPATAPYKAAASQRVPVHRIDKSSRHVTPCAAVIMNMLADELIHKHSIMLSGAQT